MMSQSSDRNMFLLVCDGLVVEISTMDRRQDSTFVHFTSFLLVAFPFHFLQQRLLSKYIYYMMFYHSLNVHVMSLCPCPSTSTLSMHIHVMQLFPCPWTVILFMSIVCRSVHALILPSCLCSRIVTLSLSVYCHSVNWHMLLVCPYPCTVTLFTPMSMHCHSVHVLVRPPFPCPWSVTLCMFKYVSLPMSMYYHLVRGITLSMAIYCHSTHTHVLSLCPCLRT